jgi:hypothetical protein
MSPVGLPQLQRETSLSQDFLISGRHEIQRNRAVRDRLRLQTRAGNETAAWRMMRQAAVEIPRMISLSVL